MIRSIGVTNLSKSSVRKINRMIDGVLANPKLFNQNTFGSEGDCGTICCGAGFAVFYDNRKLYNQLMKRQLDGDDDLDWESAAMTALELEGDYEYIQSLFGMSWNWPSPFDHQYEQAITPKAKAQVFARRWRHFIKTDGAE
jgi:hypothetical protein